MGATGPCGPCTEIHYDRIGGRDAASLVNADRPDVIEIWNNVFIQFNREADGSLKELPSKHVDTGMGFERLASILQGKDSNYDTDIFAPIFRAIQEITGARAYSGKLGVEDVGLIDMAYRVVADHIRTLVFAITDGAVPSNDGRGYVLRRILRRAVRYGQEMLNAPSGFFAKLVPVVVQNFSDAFPELVSREEFVIKVIADEEQSFNRTLDQGVKHFKKVASAIEAAGGQVIPAKEAHFLFSSMGFPLDLTELMAAERNLTVDKEGFELLMENDRKISEAAELLRKGGSTKDLSMEAEQTAWLQSQSIAATDSSLKYSWNITPPATVKAIFGGKGGATAGFLPEVAAAEGLVGLVLDQTSFYYESGGQIFDTGSIVFESGAKFTVTNAQSYAGFVVHVGFLEGDGIVKVGDTCTVQVDYDRRSLIAPNHTMTHVLNYALRSVLLSSSQDSNTASLGLCDQKGSLVDPEKLRFDFSWGSALTPQQIAQVEGIVNDRIKAALPVYGEVVSLQSASQISGLRKVFGEKYPDPVRVLSVGEDVAVLLNDPQNSNWTNLSIEFCGGTHLTNTAQAEDFVLVEESGIAKGIRRIVGYTRAQASQARKRAAELIAKLDYAENLAGGSELLSIYKSVRLEVDQAVVSLVDKEVMRKKLNAIFETIRAYNKANSAVKLNAANSKAEEVAQQALNTRKAIVIANIDFGADGKVARKIYEKLKSVHPSGSFFVVSADDDGERIGVYPFVSQEHLAAGLNAKEWVEFCISRLGTGKGGGKADQANANFPNTESLPDQLFTFAAEFVKDKFSLFISK
eukprot:scaffold659_cov192-Ochromonas_danica.AAC.83